MLETLGLTLAANALVFLALWLLSLRLRDASIVDVYWGPGFAVLAWTAWLSSGANEPRAWLALGLVTLWGLRLGGYLAWRNAGRGEDPRYQAMRRHHGARFARVSLLTVFGLQGALMWLVSWPLQWSVAAPGPGLGAADVLGVALVVGGLLFESVGDWQLARFKADPANRGAVLDRGLWRYTRHPNYFGDCLVWWGLFALAASTRWGVLTVLSPIVMTTLLLRVSGVALLERGLARSRPAYGDYQARTSAFFPWPPRRS